MVLCTGGPKGARQGCLRPYHHNNSQPGVCFPTHPDPLQVLVTHQVEFLPRCDTVAIMDEGRCVYYGELTHQRECQHDYATCRQFADRSHCGCATWQTATTVRVTCDTWPRRPRVLRTFTQLTHTRR